MILFLIEIFLLGCAIAAFFREKIEDFFLSFLAILLGLFGFFMTVLFLTVFQVPLSAQTLLGVMGVELIGLILVKWRILRRNLFLFRWSILWYLAGGLFFILGSMFFLRRGYVFASPDSLYLVIMGRSILETGLTEWYYTSPLQWGMFAPVTQIIGMLFGYDYSWFIQPMISFTFLVLFGTAIVLASRDLVKNKVMPYVLAGLSVGLLVSSNLFWIAQFYIHTNLDTGISLFIVVSALYFAIRNKNDAWLGIASIFLILLGLTRTENVILAALVIVLTIATRKLSQRQLNWTFLPYMVVQILWNMVVIRINPITFGNILTTSQLGWVTIGLVAFTLFILFAGNRWVMEKVLPRLNLLVIVGISVMVAGLILFRFEKTFLDFWDTLQTMFATGKWFATFWGVVALLLLLSGKHTDNKTLDKFFDILIFAFFGIIVILGFLKGNYHKYWYDSANRMYIHILPIMVFYLILKISAVSSFAEPSKRLE